MSAPKPIQTIYPHLDFLERLESYVPGEQPREPSWVKLNTNEFPYPAAPEVLEAIRREAADTVRIYPNPSAAALREALATRHRVSPEYIIIGNGSDEILRYLMHAWLDKKRRLAVVHPTYTLYQTLAAMFSSQVDVHPLHRDETLPESLFAGGWAACFLPVPNPPLGTTWPGAQLLRLAETGGLLVLDGAYVDFIDSRLDRELLPIRETLETTPNIVFTRTFSKSFGLAGLRVGYAIARPEIITDLHKLRDSYNVNRISQAAALAALQAEPYYRAKCNEIIQSRNELIRELSARGFTVPASQGNFIFARHPRAAQLYTALKERKILVRHFAQSGLEDGLRITIGTPDENSILLSTLDKVNL